MQKFAAERPLSLALPFLATIAAMASFQIGAAVAKSLFPALGAEGAAVWRLGLGALLLIAILRPWRAWPAEAPLTALGGLGLTMATTILFFYLAVERLPLAAAISLQFLGPLAIAVFGSRRRLDLVWAALAAGGVWLLVGAGSAGLALDPLGVACALLAAMGWAGYILLGRRVSAAFGASTAGLALGLSAILVLPVGASGAAALFDTPALVPTVVLMAVFSSAVPFTLEFYAMPRMPARTFAVLTSLEPVFGVLAGLVLLGEWLAAPQLAGVGMVVVAAAGATWSGAGEQAAPKHAGAPPA